MRPAAAAVLFVLGQAAPAQEITIGPQAVLASYREVVSGLRYAGFGFGGAMSVRFHKLSVDGVVTRVKLDTADGSAATQSFTATQFDVWVGYDVAPYASLEVGIIRRTADPELDAQSVGAVRLGARSFYEIGPGATILFRANYLAAPKFSGVGCVGRRRTHFSGSIARPVRAAPGRSTRRSRRPWGAWGWRSRSRPEDRSPSGTPVPGCPS